MNSTQQLILVIGGTVMLAMLAYQPYAVTYQRSTFYDEKPAASVTSVQYAPVWDAPKTGFRSSTYTSPTGVTYQNNGRVLDVAPDYGRLAVQLVAALVVFGIAVALSGRKREETAV